MSSSVPLGVPQGTHLGPYSFKIFNNYLRNRFLHFENIVNKSLFGFIFKWFAQNGLIFLKETSLGIEVHR